MNVKDKPLGDIEQAIPLNYFPNHDNINCCICGSKDCYDIVLRDNQCFIMYYNKWFKLEEPLCKKHYKFIQNMERSMWKISKFILKAFYR